MSMMQQKVPSPSGKGTVWVCPIRDIAHMTPQVMAQALNLLASQCDAVHGQERIDGYAAAVQRFIRLAADPSCKDYVIKDTPQAAWKRAGMDQQPDALHRAYAECYMQLMFTCYFNGIREALHPGEHALGLDELMAAPIRVTARQRLRRLFRK